LEAGGAAEKISAALINAFGEKNIQWAVMVTGFLVGIPLYYNAGFVILVPLVFSITKRTNLPLLYVAIPMAASLSTTHCFLPPHPGPAFLVKAFNADMGQTLLYGLMIAIPVIIIAGPLLGRMMQRIKVNAVNFFGSTEQSTTKNLPPAFPSFLVALLPVLLITLAVVATNFMEEGDLLRRILLFAGDPVIALLLTVLIAISYFGWRNGESVDTTTKWVNQAISGIAVILLIITAGGIFKQVLTDSGTGDYIASFSEKWNMPPLLFGWTVTALLRVTIGSATVAGITAAGIVTPLVTAGAVSPELMVLAVGTGSVFGSHVNDSGFWMFKEFFNLSLSQTFLSWTVMETTISILGLGGVLILDQFI
jgi:Gnt-I system high-affinity gluconate transporter